MFFCTFSMAKGIFHMILLRSKWLVSHKKATLNGCFVTAGAIDITIPVCLLGFSGVK